MTQISHRSIFALLLSLVFCAPDVKAQTTTQYCRDNNQCYDTLAQAESAMRSSSVFGERIKLTSKRLEGVAGYTLPQIIYHYEVKNTRPEIIYPDAYYSSIVDGQTTTTATLNCTPAGPPYDSDIYCTDEMEAMMGTYNYYTREYPSIYCPQGTKTPMVIGGSHEIPFTTLERDAASSVPGFGVVLYGHSHFNEPYDQEQTRHITFTTQCAAEIPPTNHWFGIAKITAFKCPEKFKSIWLDSHISQYSAQDFYSEVCEPNRDYQTHFEIRTIVKTVNSCHRTDNPCHPATGDKSRTETDFEFAGRSFSRYYHSIGEVSDRGFGNNWTHSYSDSIKKDSLSFYLINANGTFEGISQLSGIYRPENSDNRSVEVFTSGPVAYRLKDSIGEVKDFNTSGQLIAVRDTNNVAKDVTLTYVGDRLDKVTDMAGRFISFEYIGDLISRIILPDGEIIDYTYDTGRNLIFAEANQIKEYHYTESGLANSTLKTALTGITYDGTRYASFGYDDAGRVTSSTLLNGTTPTETATLQYNSDSQVTVTENGEQKSYSIQPGIYRKVLSISGPRGTNSYTYDAQGRTATTTDRRGVVTKYDYPSNYTRARTEGFGTPSQRRIETDTNGPFGPPSQQRTYNAANTLVSRSSWTYNARGQITTATYADPASSTQRVITNAYCEQADVAAGTCPLVGLLISVNGPRTDVLDITTYTYYPSDDAGCANAPATCPHRKGDLWKVTNALGHVTETLAYSGAGRPLLVKDVNGTVAESTYHAHGWLTSRTIRGVTAAEDRSTVIDYWPSGLVRRVTQADGSYTTYAYDSARRLTDVSDNDGNVVHYTLNSVGNRTVEDTRDPNGALTRTLSRVYDQLQRIQSESDAYQHAMGYTYDSNGNVESVTDALNRITDNDYDPLNRLSRTLQDVGGIAAETKYQYDALDNLTRVTDPKGLNTDYLYNGLSDLKQLTSPDTGITSYTYDSGGNRKTQTDARGIATSYSYDALNRLTSVSYPTSGLNVTYQYDAVSPVCAAGETYSTGRLTQVLDSSGSTQYCYTRFGELARKVQVINGKAFTTRYGHDGAGRLANLIYPDGAIADFVRDGQGRVFEVGITSPNTTRKVLLSNANYAPFGPLRGWTYGNGRTLSRSLNLNYQATAIQDAGAGGLSLSFGYDAVGNLNLLQNASQTASLAQYSHDALGRLTQVKDGPTGTPIETYAYDDTGNRTAVMNAGTNTNYTYPNSSHRLTKVGKVARSYNASGSMTGNGTLTFVYDDTSRLSQVKNGQTVLSNYSYNGKGEQVRSYLGAANTYYVYDEVGHLLGEFDNAGAPLKQILWLDDLPIGVLVGSGASQALHYIEPDHLGTPRTVIDGTRNVAIWRWDLNGEAFGNTPPNQNPDGDATNFVFNLRYPGQRYDAASGLNYNYFRDYDPSTGRYIESDPIGLMGDISTYSYVSSSPFTYIDSTGLVKWEGRVGFGHASKQFKFKYIPIKKIDFSGLTIEVTSDCIGGYKVSTSLTGTSLSGRMDASTNSRIVKYNPIANVQFGWLKVRLFDDRNTPDEKALEGKIFMMASGGKDATGSISVGEAKGTVSGMSLGDIEISGDVKLNYDTRRESCTCSL